MKESEIEKSIKNTLRNSGWFVFKNHQSLGSYKGVADLYCIRDGRSVWVEVKKEKGYQSIYQQNFEKKITEHGGEYFIAKSIQDLIDRKMIDALF